ncbi:MAG: ABC transporter substrate-binding protein [Streptosporangiales bacterium]
MGLRRLSLLVVASLAALAACSGGSGSSADGGGSPQHGGTLTIVREQASKTLSKTQMHLNSGIWLIQQVLDTLYVATPDGQDLKPDLAKSYDVSKDKKTWTFHLRKGVKFSDGSPLTAKDVKFSIGLNGREQSPWSFVNSAIASIDTPDKSTVRIHTKHPWSPLLADVALFANAIVPANFGGKSEDEFYQKPIGTGPFMIAARDKGNSITLKRNPHYWRKGKPYLDKVKLVYVENSNSRVIQAQGGKADIAQFPPYSALNSLKNSTDVTAKTFESSRTNFLIFNTEKKPFDDWRVRHAIALAVNRKPMIKAAFFGNAKPATSFLTPSLWAHQDVVDMKQRPDLAEAKQLMKQAGYGGGFSAKLTLDPGNNTGATVAQILQEQLKKIGVNISIRKDSNSSTNKSKGNYEMALSYVTTDIIDPDELVGFIAVGTGGVHALYTRYNNPKLNKLATEAARTFKKSERQKMYTKIQEMVAHDSPFVPLVYPPFAYVVSNDVHNFEVHTVGSYPLENVWVSQ